MPTVTFEGEEIDCEDGATLRDVLLEAGLSPHNGRAALLNCRGHGTCGTCAVEIDGPASEPTTREKRRLSVPPHGSDGGLRLSCQTEVQGDLNVEKHGGFWGQHTENTPRD
ncbi:2Fe-2S iron-sulfur cluster-binding protein [Natronococcus roseus]|uniref:2Fe-2S iron-sulfur cluster-binding protein n=1 Tax=Natronococcus roseus TaxID=1052014 RepID=UPI00374D78C5